jgi:hypothetical protein
MLNGLRTALHNIQAVFPCRLVSHPEVATPMKAGKQSSELDEPVRDA